MAIVRLTVNGQARSVDVDPTTLLPYVLRNDLDLTGSRFTRAIARAMAPQSIGESSTKRAEPWQMVHILSRNFLKSSFFIRFI